MDKKSFELRKLHNVEKLFFWALVALSGGNLLSIILHLRSLLPGVWGLDYRWIWRECACALRGMDVAAVVESGQYVEGLGVLPQPLATMPWARVIGNLITPGFLPENLALGYGVCIYIVAAVLGWSALCSLLLQRFPEYRKGAMLQALILLPLLNFYLVDAVTFFNLGFFLSFLLMIMVWLLAQGSAGMEIGAGVLLAFAMFKPQIGGIFFVALLFKKRFKAIAAACGTLVVGWGSYLLWIGGNPIRQFMEIFGRGAEEFYWYGLLDGLRSFGVPDKAVMLLSMAFCMVITAVLMLVLRKSPGWEDSLLCYMIPAFFSAVWSYKSTSDLVILSWAALLAFYYLAYSEKRTFDYLSMLVFLGLFNVKVFSGLLRRVLGYEWLVGTSLDAWVRSVLFVVVFLYVVKKMGHTKDTPEGGKICAI